MNANTNRLEIRVSPDLRQRLEALAEADRRSVGQLARNVLADFVARKRPSRRREAA
jgi:predicted transcriptional regulator